MRKLSTLLFLAILSFTTWAYDFQVDQLCYNINDENPTEVEVTYQQEPWSNEGGAYLSLSGSLTIPSTVTYNGTTYTVVSIEENAFSGCSSLTSVTIPEGATSIGYAAFSGCSSLTSVIIPEGVTSIGEGAFSECYSLSSITIPNSVTSIGDGAFFGCSSLTSITIPNSLTSIEASVFTDCSSLISVTIPSSVTSIGGAAFSGCLSLTSIAIPNSVTSIGDDAFFGCSYLSIIYIEAQTPPALGSNCFYATNLNVIFVPSSTSNAYASAWGSDYLYVESGSEVELTVHVATPGGLATAIAEKGYTPDQLNKITVVGSLNDTDFGIIKNNMTSLIDLNLEGIDNTTLPYEAFKNKNRLLNVVLPANLTAIPDWAFSSCSSLPSITIPNSVTSIGWRAFRSCFSLSSVTVGSGVESIGYATFEYCFFLDTITCLGGNPPVVNEAFATINPSTCKLYVPQYALMDYIQAPVWGAFLNMQGIDVDYALSIQMNEGGKIVYNNQEYTANTELTIDGGSQVTLQVVPDEGYTINNITYDGDYQISEDGTLTLSSVKQDGVLDISFFRGHLISFVNYDGTILQSDYVEYGDMPYYYGWETPYKPATDEYYYEFIGWSPEITSVTGDATYIATFTEIKRTYNVYFYNGDYLLGIYELPYGETPVYTGETPTQPETQEYTYEFAGWSPELSPVTGEAYYYATFTEVRKQQHTIAYYYAGSAGYFANTCYTGQDFTVRILAHEGNTIQSVTLNGVDITSQLEADGTLTLYNITEDQTLVVAIEDTPSNISSSTPNHLRAWQANGTIFAEVDDSVATLLLYDVSGRLINEHRHNGTYQVITLPAPNEVNILNVVGKDGSITAYKLM